MKNDLPWIEYAKALEGAKEVPGPGNNPTIITMLIQLKFRGNNGLNKHSK